MAMDIMQTVMQTIRLSFYALTAVLLVGWTTATVAQDQYFQDEAEMRAHIEQVQQEARQRHEVMMEAHRAMQRSPAMQQMQRDMMRQMMNSVWASDGLSPVTMGYLQNPDFREGLGISEEQMQGIQRAPQGMMDDPNARQFRDEMDALMAQDPFGPNGTEELQHRFMERQMQVGARMQEIMMERMSNAIHENLTPEQIQGIREAQISTMDAIPIVSPSMFEALDLSDAQRRQLDAIKREMQPEFERHTDKMVDTHVRMMEAMQESMERMRNVTDPEERARLSANHSPENILRTNPDLQRAMNELMASGTALSGALRGRMSGVLTSAQWARMMNLIDNPPEYVKGMLAEMRRQMGVDEPQATSRQPGGGWVPGPGAWRPGDPVPERLQMERNPRGGFPRGE